MPANPCWGFVGFWSTIKKRFWGELGAVMKFEENKWCSNPLKTNVENSNDQPDLG